MTPTIIKLYDTVEEILIEATGAITHTYTVGPQGLYRSTEDWNRMKVIHLYTDSTGKLFGLFYPLT